MSADVCAASGVIVVCLLLRANDAFLQGGAVVLGVVVGSLLLHCAPADSFVVDEAFPDDFKYALVWTLVCINSWYGRCHSHTVSLTVSSLNLILF